LLVIFSLIMTLFVLLRDPFTQTFLARFFTTYLSEELKTGIKIEEMTVTAFWNIWIKGVEVNDQHQQNILSAKSIEISINHFNYRNQQLGIKKIILDQSEVDLKVYRDEEQQNFQFLIDYFSGKKADTIPVSDTIDHKPWDIVCNTIQLNKSAFSIINENRMGVSEGIDYDAISVSDINLDLELLKLEKDSVSFIINGLSCVEKSGFDVKHLSGEFLICPDMLKVQALEVTTNKSKLDLDFQFSFNDFGAFNSFIDEVMIDADIRNSWLNLSDIGYFAPEMFIMDDPVFINTVVHGTVENFKSRRLKFTFGKHTNFMGQLEMIGLPDIENTKINLRMNEFHTSAEDLSKFALPLADTFLKLPPEIYEFGEISMIGFADGRYRDFESNFVLQSGIGNLSSTLNMFTPDSSGITSYNGRIQSLGFDLGKVLRLPEYLGTMNLDLYYHGSGLSAENMLLNLDGVVRSVELNQSTFNEVKINAELADNKFDGHLSIADEKIDLEFDGGVDFKQEIPRFNFYSNIQHAHLFDINLLKTDSSAVLSSKLNINFAGIKPDDMEGVIQIDSTVLLYHNKSYSLNNLSLNVYYDSIQQKIIELNSDYIDANIKGKFLFKELFTSVKSLVAQYVPHMFSDSLLNFTEQGPQKLDFEINLKQTNPITELLYPKLKIAPKSIVKGFYHTDQNLVYLEANSKEIEIGGIKFYDWYLKTDNDEDAFLLMTGSKDMAFKEATKSDTTAIGLENLNLLAWIQNDSIDYRLAWDDFETIDDNTGYFSGYLKFISRTESEMRVKRADFMINNTAWNIDLNSHLYFDKYLLSIDSFNIYSAQQSLSITGTASGKAEDTLKVSFKNWDISNFDLIMSDPNLNFDGTINGNINLMDMYDSPKITANLGIEELTMNQQLLGRAEISSLWNNEESTLDATLDIINIGNAGESKVFGIYGTYYPLAQKNNLDFGVDIRNFNLKTLSPFVSDFMSEVEGLASGRLNLDGTLKKPRLIGNLNLMRAGVKVDYLNVGYSLANEVKFRENEISFDQVVLYDKFGNQAECSGKIEHDYFRNFELDVNIRPENVLVMNTDKYQNSLFYGDAMASGDVHIHGPFEEIVMDINLQSKKGTKVFIPINYEMEIAKADFIVFVNATDTVEEETEYNVDLSGVSLNLNLSVNQDAEIELYLPYGMGNIKADGNGDINILVNSRGDFEILGDYFINEGTFLFTLQNLVNRRFSILEGGKISWTGNPYEAEIDIKTLYKTKASLAGFGIESDRRYNIDCFLELSEQLMDPAIHFSIGIPNIDKDDEQLVFAQLDTQNDAQMNQQMISLLVLGSFSASSSSIPSAEAIGASSINVISNQLSNWLSQISKDFDVGINYRPSGEYTQDELEVALSTQLFNNRVLIDGNLGVLSQTSNNTSNIVGDVNVEVKLTDDGKLRIKVFNRSNINSIETSYDERAPNTQGVGIFYRKEFDNFGDLFIRRKQKKDSTVVI